MLDFMVLKKERDKFSHRLALACDKAGIPDRGRQTELALRLKLTPKAVSKWFNDEAIPRKSVMDKLALLLGTSPQHLYGYTDHDGIHSGHYQKKMDVYRVDVLDVQASAGQGTMLSTEFVEKIRAIEYTNEQARSMFNGRPQETVKVITVNGDSMEGTINPGDEIFVDISVNHFDGDGIYVFVFGRSLHVKRLQMVKDKISVISDNPAYDRWHIDKDEEDQLFIMAKVLIRQSIDIRRFG